MLPHVDDLIALLDELDAAPAHLIGDSWGAFIALLAAIREPRLVRSLILQEPPALSLFVDIPPSARELLTLLARRPRTAVAIIRLAAGTIVPAEKAFARGDDEQALLTFAHGVLGREVFEGLPEARRQQARDNLGVLRAGLPTGFPPLADEQVRGVAAPVLLVEGEHSPAAFHRIIDRLAELLPAAQRREIAAASHSMHEQQPEVVNRAILDFLAAAGATG